MNIKRLRSNYTSCKNKWKWSERGSATEDLWWSRYILFRQEYERRLTEIANREDKERKERFERNELTRLFKKYLRENGSSTIYTTTTFDWAKIDWSKIDWRKPYGKAS